MKFRLPLRGKQLLITIHVLAVVCWLGGALVMLLLGSYMLKSSNGEQLYYTLANMHLVDMVMIRYTALAAFLTGLALSVWTNWGLFTYYWIVIKLVLTLSLIVFGIGWMGDWLSAVISMGDAERMHALSNPSFLSTSHALLGGAIANIAGLVFMTAISYFKPFGRIRKTARKG
ncbi:hypothetical protein ACFO9Q_19915 [Paenibacillus sp. GCM10023252]|uniref:hypothetical protein n=1 Tax=Paenibacillus sp. GCM10023252 TaxID=3252649 RepID=UPI00362212EF